MSCGYCGTNSVLCLKSDMNFCIDCYESVKQDYCTSCEDNIKSSCPIYNSSPNNSKEVKNLVINFFVDQKITSVDDIIQRDRNIEYTHNFMQKLFDTVKEDVLNELEDFGWL